MAQVVELEVRDPGGLKRRLEAALDLLEGLFSPLIDKHMGKVHPAPGGSMSLARVPEMLDTDGKDLIFLVGGGFFKLGPNLIENCRFFRKMVEQYG